MTHLTTRLRADLSTAMRDRDRERAQLLRTVLSAIANAEAQPVDALPTGPAAEGPVAGAAVGLGATEAARRELSADDVRAIVAAERDERLSAAEELQRRGAVDAADTLRAEAAALDTYLAREKELP